MDTNQENLNLFHDRMSVKLIDEINFEEVLKVMKTRDTFARYTQLNESDDENENNISNHSSTNRKELLKSIITNECELKEFISILLHTGHDSIAQELDPKVIDLCDFTQCDPKSGHKDKFSFGDTNAKDILIDKDVSTSLLGVYTMISSPRGYCYLINNYFTIGTYKEMQRLRNIFYQLHFHVEMRKNLKINQIKDLLIDLCNPLKSHELSEHNAFVFIIITYGDNKKLFDSKDDSIDILELTQLLDDEKCPQMKGKPRLFFFNCCQNETLKECAKTTEVTEKSKISAPNNDVFICISTLDKTISWDKGTHFGKHFANILVEKAYNRDINNLTTKINCHMELTFGIGKYIEWTTLSKTLYFCHLIPHKRAYVSSTKGISTTTIEQTLEDFMLNGFGKSLGKKILIQISEQLCKEVKDLHKIGIVHKNINPQSIEISTPKDIIVGDFDKIKIQLKLNSDIGSSNNWNPCWMSPEILENFKNYEKFEASKENDIFCLGCVIYYVMTRGQHPFDKKLDDLTKSGMNLKALSGDPQNQIYVDLIERMLEYNKTDRPSIDVVSIHPMFWESNIILQFYTDIKNLFHTKNDKGMETKNFKSIQQRVIRDLKSKSSNVYGHDWLKKLSSEIQTYEKTKKNNLIRDSTSYIDLVDYIRNKDQHYDECPQDIKNIFGKNVETYIKYFTDRFPLLLIYTYNAMKVFKAERKLANYYK